MTARQGRTERRALERADQKSARKRLRADELVKYLTPEERQRLEDIRAGRAPLTFVQWCKRVRPGVVFYWHNLVLARQLQRIADDELHRLMVFMPPRHGKSEEVSRLFSAYYLYRHPDRWVGLCSYGADLAMDLSANARENFEALGGETRKDTRAKRHWRTAHVETTGRRVAAGGMWAAGVGGPITGKGFHLGIIDDPLKNNVEALSEKIRKKQKNWYQSTFYSREEPGGAIIIMMTRWHVDDLAGWLLQEELADDGQPENWHILDFPAIRMLEPSRADLGRPVAKAEEKRKAVRSLADLKVDLADTFGATAPTMESLSLSITEHLSRGNFPYTCTVEPDPRKPGDALCPARRDINRLSKIKHRSGPHWWAAMWQQRPVPEEGAKFKRAWFTIVTRAPRRLRALIRYWDIAATEGDGDYTAGTLMGLTEDWSFIVLDVQHYQHDPDERDKLIRQQATMDLVTARKFGCKVIQWGQQEPAASGKQVAIAFRRMLARLGCAVNTEPVSGDKAVRADPFASAAGSGLVTFLAGLWNEPALAELASFPYGSNDDIVDTMSGAHSKLAAMVPVHAGEYTNVTG